MPPPYAPTLMPPKKHLPLWLSILIVCAAGIAAWAYVARVSRQGPVPAFAPYGGGAPVREPEAVRAPGQTAALKAATTPLGELIPPAVNAYVGAIVSISTADRTFVLAVSANRNYLSADREFTVEVNERTLIERRVMPAAVPQEGSFQIEKEPIAFADLAAGDEVVAASSANLKGVSSFAAEWVQKIN